MGILILFIIMSNYNLQQIHGSNKSPIQNYSKISRSVSPAPMVKFLTSLLFCETLIGDEKSLGAGKRCISVNEICFRRPVSLSQIKIIKNNHLYHSNMCGKIGRTTTDLEIKDFQIFGKNLYRPADK